MLHGSIGQLASNRRLRDSGASTLINRKNDSGSIPTSPIASPLRDYKYDEKLLKSPRLINRNQKELTGVWITQKVWQLLF